MAKVQRAVGVLIAVLAIGATFSCSAMASSGSSSSSSTATIQNPTTVTVTEEATNEKHASAGTFIKFKVLSYVKAQGLTKVEVANAKECRMIGEGTDVPVYTNSGISSSGAFVEFEDHDREKACLVNGVWRLVRCGNIVHFYVKPNIFHGQVLLVKSFAFKKIRVHIPLHVKVSSPCGGSPAESVAKIDQWVRYKAVAKAKGDVKIRISGKIIDRVKAHVRAGATCKKTTTTITEEGPPCTTCKPPPCHTCEEPPVHFVQVECQAPEHIYTNDKVFMYCVTSNDDGSLISLNVFSETPSLATVGSQKSVSVKNQVGDPCPSGAQCFRVTVTAGSSSGIAYLTAIATSNGAEGIWLGETRIEADDFGT